MADLYPLFAAILTLSVFAACYCRIRHLRGQNREIDYTVIPSVSPVPRVIAVPKPSAPPMSTIEEEEGDPVV